MTQGGLLDERRTHPKPRQRFAAGPNNSNHYHHDEGRNFHNRLCSPDAQDRFTTSKRHLPTFRGASKKGSLLRVRPSASATIGPCVSLCLRASLVVSICVLVLLPFWVPDVEHGQLNGYHLFGPGLYRNTSLANPTRGVTEKEGTNNNNNNNHTRHGASTTTGRQDPLRFVLHVGLPKTATTHLQCSLCANPNATIPLLQQDHWIYLGTCPIGECRGGHELPFSMQGPGKGRHHRRHITKYYNDLYLAHQQGSFFQRGGGAGPMEEAGSNPVGPFPHALDRNRIWMGIQERRRQRHEQQAPPGQEQLAPSWMTRKERRRQRHELQVPGKEQLVPSWMTRKLNATAKADAVGSGEQTNDLDEKEDEEEPWPELSLEFRQRVKHAYEQGLNAMVIFEGSNVWSHRHIQVMRDFLEPQWEVHVVAAYRPLFDWLPSKYNSIIKPTRNRAGRIWPGQSLFVGYLTNAEQDNNNPDKDDDAVIGVGSTSSLDNTTTTATLTGEAIAPFRMDHLSAGHSPHLRKSSESDELFSDFIHDVEVKYHMHPAHMLQSNFRQYFDHVHIMSLPHLGPQQSVVRDNNPSGWSWQGLRHWFGLGGGTGGDPTSHTDRLLYYLFCQVLPGQMPITCQTIERTGSLKNSTKPASSSISTATTTTNPSIELDYDMLAVAAYQQGLIRVEKGVGYDEEAYQPTRPSVAENIRRHQVHLKSTRGGLQVEGPRPSFVDFPLLCWDTASLNRLETLSWNVEYRLFFGDGDALKNEGSTLNATTQQSLVQEYQDLHRVGFAKAQANHKFCSIDANKTLQDPHWRDWFVSNFVNISSTSVRDSNKRDNETETDQRAGGNRPLFILHVGLPKTATTHLQCSLCANAAIAEPLLRQDKLVYLGTCPIQCGSDIDRENKYLKHQQLAFFQRSPLDPNANPVGPFPHGLDPQRANKKVNQKLARVSAGPPMLNPDFVSRVDEIWEDGLGILIVFEGCTEWSSRHIATLAQYLKRKNRWEVHIVVAYRPLFEWLPSKYNSVVKPLRNRAARLWPGHRDDNQIVGEEILPFALDNRSAGNTLALRRHGGVGNHDVNGFGDYVQEIEVRYQMHPAHVLYHNYQQHFENVHIMSLSHLNYLFENGRVIPSQSDPLLDFVFCQLLPPKTRRWPTLCWAVRKGRLVGGTTANQQSSNPRSSQFANPSVDLNFDMLATQAYKDGWIPARSVERGVTRTDVRRMIQEYKDTKLPHVPFPVQCLDNATLSRLENLSWTLEHKFLFPNSSSVQQGFDPFASSFMSSDETTDAKTHHVHLVAEYQRLHHAEFVKAYPKFCSIDAKRTLQEHGEWRKWFVAKFWNSL